MRKSKIVLSSCPFCGKQPEIIPWHGGGPLKRMIECANDDCEVSPQVTGSTPAQAALYWNRRSKDAGEVKK